MIFHVFEVYNRRIFRQLFQKLHPLEQVADNTVKYLISLHSEVNQHGDQLDFVGKFTISTFELFGLGLCGRLG